MNKGNVILKGAAFFLAALVLASLVRVGFFCAYRGDSVSVGQFLPAFALGARVDAKWLALGLWPAWAAVLLFGLTKGGAAVWFRRAAVALAAVAAFAFFLLDFINYFFYGFYGTPISSIIFGFFQDDTLAVTRTVINEWPVFGAVAVLLAVTALPFAAARLVPRGLPRGCGAKGFPLLFAAGTAALALMTRGSLGTFPLRLQDYVVSSVKFVNDTIPNGTAAFYEAWKSQRQLRIRSALEGLKALGFASPEEARGALPARPGVPRSGAPAAPRNVVLCIMEAMGRDMFESHSKDNNTLGALAGELPGAVVFKNALSVQNGTFPTLEGILFDSPMTPVSQSRYGHQAFPFSKVLPFREAGYRTVFLTAGPETWRGISETFPLHGFDEVIGGAAIKEHFPQASYGTWGVSDEWMFREAEQVLRKYNSRGQKVFLVMLSVSNHAPHIVPDTYRAAPVDVGRLPAFISRRAVAQMTVMLQTYQYGADSLGRFVRAVRQGEAAGSTVIAATGDHNMRFQYADGTKWHHQYGVPILFWLPQGMRERLRPDPAAWASHRDIMPTLAALALARLPAAHEGRDLFAPLPAGVPAVSFTGPGKLGSAIGAAGAVAIDKNGAERCYGWAGDALEPRDACTPDLERMSAAARAQIGLADYAVRSSLMKK